MMILNKRYQLKDLIGQGGMATVYRGYDLHLERDVAIKIMDKTRNSDLEFIRRFEREAKVMAILEHANIVRLYDYGQEENFHFIITEFVEGTNLCRYLNARGIFDIDRTVIITYDVVQGLAIAHRKGIIHRDVKPANILIGRSGTIKLSDFGIATFYKDIDATELTKAGAIIGTALYMSPEQARKKTVSPATDIYSLGVVMYEMITGHPPFTGSSALALILQHIEVPPTPPRQLIPSIPLALEEIIMRCLEKEPEKRFKNAEALANALELLGEEDFI